MIKMGASGKSGFNLLVTLLVSLVLFSGKSEAQNKKRIDILHSDVMGYSSKIADAQRLLGNVKIMVDGALMWCDSLYSYTNNTVDAYGNVHIVRGDTLNMYSDFIHYNGNIKQAKARMNVRLIDRQVILTTDSLDYDMQNDVAYYNYDGTIKDSTNVLNSRVGQYFVNEKKAYFKTKVDVTTKDYKIKSDTLIYYTDIKKVYIEGPTRIFNEKDTLYSEYGWYDSMKGLARLTRKPVIWNAKQKVLADSIFYNKQSGAGIAFGHARIRDFENNIEVTGNLAEYNDQTKIAMATDSAVLIQYSKTDTLYLHADKLKAMPDTSREKPSQIRKITSPETGASVPTDSLAISKEVADSLATAPVAVDMPEPVPTEPDSLRLTRAGLTPAAADSLNSEAENKNRIVQAWYKVRFFRNDFQGKCDSLVYFSKDSTIRMYHQPVIWSDNNQISANYIEMINKSKNNDEVRMEEDAFIIAMEDDSLRFNQIKGKNMVGYIRNNELLKIDVDGNGQSNYYARDKNGIIGLNKAQSSNITIYMNRGKVKKITFIRMPDGELKPLEQLDEGDKLLPGFKWQEEVRPVDQADIFRDPLTTPPPARKKPAAKPAELPKEETATPPTKVE